jgi:hypothetical protein
MFIADNPVGEMGLLVDKLTSDGLASGCGLAAGDVLLAVNGSLCRSHQQARAMCDAAASLELVLQVRSITCRPPILGRCPSSHALCALHAWPSVPPLPSGIWRPRLS